MSGQSDKRLMLEGLDKSGDIQGIADSYTTLPAPLVKLWTFNSNWFRDWGGQIVSCQLKSLRRV